MNKKTVFFAVLLAAAGVCSRAAAQGAREGSMNGQAGNTQAVGINNFTNFVKRTGSAVDGSPYADSRWLTAHLQMTDNAQIPPLPLRYDVLNKRLVMQSSDAISDSAQLNDNSLVSFELDEPAAKGQPARKRFFRRFMESPEPAKMADYVEVLHAGKSTLLKHYEKTYIKAAPSNGMAETRDRIGDKVTYYVSRPGTAPLPVKLTLKSMQLVLPDLAPALKANTAAQSAKTEQEWAAVLNSVDPK